MKKLKLSSHKQTITGINSLSTFEIQDNKMYDSNEIENQPLSVEQQEGQYINRSHIDKQNKTHNNSKHNKKQFISDIKLFYLTFVIFIVVLSSTIIYANHSEGTKDQLFDIYNFREFITSDKRIENYKPNDFYWFSVSIRDLILNSNLDSLYRRNRSVYSVKRDIHLRAILFVQLTHNINFNGEINVQISPFDDNMLRKRKVIERILYQQKRYYEQKYQISKYNDHEITFCIVIPSYNNVKSKLYLRNLDSIFMQDYQNYHVVYIDDHSPDKTGMYVNQYLKQKKIPEEKIKVIINQQNKKALQNIYEGIHQHCKNGEIAALIDGDDSLIGRLVFKLYNAVFREKQIAFMYSNFLKITQNSRTQFGFGGTVSRQYFQAGNLRNYWPLIGTHFMAFYTDLFKMIQKKDLCYQNGTFYDYAYDRAIFTPLIQMSFPHIEYIPEMVYQYRNDTGINDGGSEWYRVSLLIRQQKPYQNLKELPFVYKKQKSTPKAKTI